MPQATSVHYILFDDTAWKNVLPLTYTKPVGALRVGILTIQTKWEKHLKSSCSFLTQNYLSKKYTLETGEQNILINSSLLPSKGIVDKINDLKNGELLVYKDIILAAYLSSSDIDLFKSNNLSSFKQVQCNEEVSHIRYPWDIFALNGQEVEADFILLTAGRSTARIPDSNNVIAPENIFVEPGAKLEFVTLNASTGPIYIGKESEIMEGTSIRGPFALCEHSVVKLSAKIYGPTTIGPYSKVGGEINNSVVQGYSNKAHDGFLGNSVIGEWCNLGADTNNSNLKNNYADVKVWNYDKESFINTGRQFCGLIMGDHSKCGINTMFNTGTVVGVSANIFGSGFPRNFIPSFSWGGAQGFTTFALNKVFEVAEKVMRRRDIPLDDIEKDILKEIFNQTEEYRKK